MTASGLFGASVGNSGINSNMTGLELFGASAGTSGVNSALGVGEAFLQDWFGDQNRKQSADLDWWNYNAKSALDWHYYSDYYAPLNQKLQKDMFDYTSAGNLAASKEYYDYTIDSMGRKKQALIKAGYNPILAINGGVGVVGGTLGSTGQLGAIGSPHSASGVASGSSAPSIRGGRLSLGEMLGALSSAAQTDKVEAETEQIKAKTDAIRKTAQVDELKASAELEALDRWISSDDGTIAFRDRDKGFEQLKKSFENKYELERYLNSVERQKILDAVGVGVDVSNSASSFGRLLRKRK